MILYDGITIQLIFNYVNERMMINFNKKGNYKCIFCRLEVLDEYFELSLEGSELFLIVTLHCIHGAFIWSTPCINSDDENLTNHIT